MATFRTELHPSPAKFRLNHSDQVLCIGSCFAEHIGHRLRELKFQVLLNPAGIIFNPVSLCRILEMALNDPPFSEDEIIYTDGLWHSFCHHSQFSHPHRQTLLHRIRESCQQVKNFLKEVSCLMITPGTAFVFIYEKTNRIVANCHKVPAQFFSRRILSVEESTDAIQRIIELTRHYTGRIIPTIVSLSPVRHLRDGLVENQHSKATLHLAIREVCRRLPDVCYFPAYELLLDDLRDYRFYEPDMAHPNQMAIEYIQDFFEKTFFDEPVRQLSRRIGSILKAVRHRPFHPESSAHRNFVEKQLLLIQQLENEYPFLDFEAERNALLCG